jgi:hypothetical protein
LDWRPTAAGASMLPWQQELDLVAFSLFIDHFQSHLARFFRLEQLCHRLSASNMSLDKVSASRRSLDCLRARSMPQHRPKCSDTSRFRADSHFARWRLDCLAGHTGFEPENPAASHVIGIAGQLRLKSAHPAAETLHVRGAGSDFAALGAINQRILAPQRVCEPGADRALGQGPRGRASTPRICCGWSAVPFRRGGFLPALGDLWLKPT